MYSMSLVAGLTLALGIASALPHDSEAVALTRRRGPGLKGRCSVATNTCDATVDGVTLKLYCANRGGMDGPATGRGPGHDFSLVDGHVSSPLLPPNRCQG